MTSLAHERLLAEAALLTSIALTASGPQDLAGLLAGALNQLQALIPFTGGSIALVEDDQLVIRAAVGPFAAQALGQSLPHHRKGLSWRVIDAGQPILSNDLRADGANPTTPLRAYLAVPLIWHEHVLGLLAVDSTEPGVFSEADLRLVQKVAVILGSAVELVRRDLALAKSLAQRDLAQQRLALLAEAGRVLADSLDTQTTLSRLTNLLVPAFTDWLAIDLVEDDGHLRRLNRAYDTPDHARFRHLEGHLVPDAPYGPAAVVRTGEPELISHISDEAMVAAAPSPEYLEAWRSMAIRSYVTVPLIAHGRTLGALTCVQTASSDRRFHLDDLPFVRELALRVALALDNVQLYTDEQRSRQAAEQTADRLARLQRVTALLSEAVTPEEVNRVVVVHGAKALGGSRGAVVLLDESGTMLEIVESLGYPPSNNHWQRFSVELHVPAATVVQTGSPLFYETTARLVADYPLMEGVFRASGTQASALLPLAVQDRMLGVLHISFERTRQFEPDDRALMMTLAQQCAQALERARLYKAEQHARAAAEAAQRHVAFLAEASDRLAASLDQATTLNTVIHLVVPELADFGAIYLRADDGQSRILASHHTIPEALPFVTEMLRQQPQAIRRPASHLLQEGNPFLANDFPGEQLTEHLAVPPELLRALQPHALMLLPMIVREEIVGLIMLARSRTRTPYGEADLTLAAALAERAASAIENARLYAEALEAEHRKDESLALLNTFLATAPLGMAFLDTELRYIHINPTLASYNNLSVEAHHGQRLTDLFPEVAPILLPIFQEILETGEPVVNREVRLFSRLHGRLDYLSSYYPVRVANGPIVGFGVLVQDITERKQAELERAELLAREQAARIDAESRRAEFAFLADTSTQLAASLDVETTLAIVTRVIVPNLADWCMIDLSQPDGTIERAALLHRDPARSELLLTLKEAFAPDPAMTSGIPQVIRSGEAVYIPEMTYPTLRAAARSDAHMDVLMALGIGSAMLLPLQARGRTLGALTFNRQPGSPHYSPDDLALAQELTRRVALAIDNARLYQEAQSAIQLRDIFLSIASHELKTPVTTIQGYAELLARRARRDPLVNPRDLRGLETLYHQAVRLNRLIELLLDLSRLQMGQFALEHHPLDLAALVRRVAEAFQPSLERHTMTLDIPETALLIQGDELRLEQVFQNLIGNAIKYSPNGGPIAVTIHCQDGEAHCAVADRGLGIPLAAQPHLFSRFFRAGNVDPRSISGLGIGLYLVKEIITLHQGEVSVVSQEGEGSTFTVALPLLPA